MIYNKTAIFFLFLAAAILLLHNVIPHSHSHPDFALASNSHGHHHHAENSSKEHYHENSSGGDHREDKKDLADILSIIIHHSEGITFLSGHKSGNVISNLLLSIAFLVSDTYILDVVFQPPLQHYSPAEFLERISFYPCTIELRGPPSIA